VTGSFSDNPTAYHSVMRYLGCDEIRFSRRRCESGTELARVPIGPGLQANRPDRPASPRPPLMADFVSRASADRYSPGVQRSLFCQLDELFLVRLHDFSTGAKRSGYAGQINDLAARRGIGATCKGASFPAQALLGTTDGP
jgi:hypothetical protein